MAHEEEIVLLAWMRISFSRATSCIFVLLEGLDLVVVHLEFLFRNFVGFRADWCVLDVFMGTLFNLGLQ